MPVNAFGTYKRRDPSERPATDPEWIIILKTRSNRNAQAAIKAYENPGMKKAETSCKHCLNQQRECFVVPGGVYQKCVSCTAYKRRQPQDCNADFSERPTQSSRLREAIDAVQRMYDNKPDNGDMEFVQKVAEKHSSWIALRGYFPDLRSEEATKEDHSNEYIQQLRELLWTPERSQAYPRETHMHEESTGHRSGQQEKAWRQRVSWGGELPAQLKSYDTDMRNACAYLDHLDDPRVGSSQKAEILADNPMSKTGAERPQRAFDEQMVDSVLLKTIDASIGELEGYSPTSEHPNVQDARHVLIQALRNFRRAYAFWLFPRADSMTDVFERSSNGSSDIQDLPRGKGTKRENGAEREDGRKYGKGSRGERLSTG